MPDKTGNTCVVTRLVKTATIRTLWMAAAMMAVHSMAHSAAPTSAPLVQQSDVTYLGAFALPKGQIGQSSFEYQGRAVTPYTDPVSGKKTLFVGGKDGYVARVEIPANLVRSSNWSSLPVASIVQTFGDVTDGRLGSVDPAQQYNATFLQGLLPFNGKLIVGASNSYSATQQVSHGVSGLDLAPQNDFKGWYSMNSQAPPRAVGGPMTPIPAEWQSLLGGPALTGHCCISVISSTSAGPSATVFNPDSVGVSSSIPGKTVLYYDLNNPVCGKVQCEATQNEVFNLTTRVGGMAFPPGTRSLLFVGGHGTGRYCYGTSIECSNDTALSEVKGPHAQPYRYQIWAYDVNDLLAVKNGSKQTWDPKPYGIWVLTEMPNSGNPMIAGAGFDPESGRLYITQDYGTNPRVEVYQIAVHEVVLPNTPADFSIR
jgi:hypothetical protein